MNETRQRTPPPTMQARQYGDQNLWVKIRPKLTGVDVHIQHESGAALILPNCLTTPSGAGFKAEGTGFDGNTFRIEVDDATASLRVACTHESPILGGARDVRLPLDNLHKPAPPSERITGDEDTAPIDALDDR